MPYFVLLIITPRSGSWKTRLGFKIVNSISAKPSRGFSKPIYAILEYDGNKELFHEQQRLYETSMRIMKHYVTY